MKLKPDSCSNSFFSLITVGIMDNISHPYVSVAAFFWRILIGLLALIGLHTLMFVHIPREAYLLWKKVNNCIRKSNSGAVNSKRSVRKRIPNSRRWKLLRLQRFCCAHCRAFLTHMDWDHIKPWSDGGADDLNNGQMLCLSCHRVKTQQDAVEACARNQ